MGKKLVTEFVLLKTAWLETPTLMLHLTSYEGGLGSVDHYFNL